MRRPKPFFRKYTGTWYLQIGKQQVNLGPDEKAAWERYHAIMAGQIVDEESSGQCQGANRYHYNTGQTKHRFPLD